jgi:transglutaminase-like putative cysteine protease
VILLALALSLACAGDGFAAGEQKGTVTFSIDLQAPPSAKHVKLWFPYPTSTTDQTISNLKFSGNYSNFTMAQLTVSFHAGGRARKAPRLVESAGPIPPEIRRYVESEFWIPSNDRKIQAQARQIVGTRNGILAKARAVYDWVVDNTRRDPNVAGCGVGDVQATMSSRAGKCADISSVYVALARAAGVPAREVFGLRLGQPGETDITGGHHCWAEFYLPGTGWVAVDPADVRKVMLARNLDLAAAKPFREFYFGNLDEFRISLQHGGRSIAFPEGNAEKVNYFMYPYAEVDGKPLDYCQPKGFRYTIQFREG